MSHHNWMDDFGELDDLSAIPRIRNVGRDRARKGKAGSIKRSNFAPDGVVEPADYEDLLSEYPFTYNASRHERVWITESLSGFYDQQWFTDVLRQIKGGKEASVYQCLASETLEVPYLAAKIYRPRRFRNLKKDHIYREGREDLDENGNVIRNDGLLHAMKKRTDFGKQLLHTSWIEHEVQTMHILHQAGADVPVPYASGDNAILMSYIGGDEMAAPGLNAVDLEPEEVRPLFERVVKNIELMLANNRVHGDLSAYNILYWEGEITLIDFPQAVDPRQNRSAYPIFLRDVTRICEYFNRQGLRISARRLADDLWTAYGFRLTPEVHPALLDDQDEADVALWRSQEKTQPAQPANRRRR